MNGYELDVMTIRRMIFLVKLIVDGWTRHVEVNIDPGRLVISEEEFRTCLDFARWFYEWIGTQE